MRFILSALVLASLMACASKPIFISDSGRHAIDGSIYSGQATVYVIRDSSSSGAVWPITIKLDGEEKGSLSREAFVHFPAAPGRHDIWAHWNPLSGEPDVTVNAEFEGNKTYYFLFSTSFLFGGAVMQSRASLGLVDRSTGEAMTSRYKSVVVVNGR
jgi:hypothetical protein